MKNTLFTLAISVAIVVGLAAAPVAQADPGPQAAPVRLAQAAAAPGAKATEKASAQPAPPPADQAGAKAAPRIDINTASEEELATLPGIGEVRAKAIVKGRPYARKDELARRKIIPQSVYDNIRERIIAKQKP